MVPLECTFCLPSFLRLHAYVCNISSHMQWLRTTNRRDRVERLQPRCSCSLCLPLSLETNSKSKGGFTLIGIEDQRNFETTIFWLRARFWTQGVYTMVKVQGMKEQSGNNFSRCFLAKSCCFQVSTLKIAPPCLRNQLSHLDPILSSKITSIQGCFEPNVFGTRTLV